MNDAAKHRTPGTKYAGGHRIRVTPVPIPNTEVKPDTADGTAWETVWESRSLPAVIQTEEPEENNHSPGFFVATKRPMFAMRASGVCVSGDRREAPHRTVLQASTAAFARVM